MEDLSSPARPGPPHNAAVRALALEVAWVLHREGLTLSTYPEGLLAEAVRVVAARVGWAPPADENIRRLLRPAVGFCRRHGVRVPSPASANDDLTPVTARPLRCPSKMTH